MVSRIPLYDICESRIDMLSSKYEGKIEYIDISSIDNADKIIVNTQIIDSKEAPSRAKQLVQYGDILVSTVRPNLNAVAVIQKESEHILVASTGYCVLRCNKEIDNHYVFHFCQSLYFIDDMVRQATGASYPAVSNSIVKSCLIPLRSIEEQHYIADMLDKVDDLIFLRQRQLAKLDELVKARFVEMFGNEQQMSRWPCGHIEDVADVCVGVVIKPTQYYASAGIPAFRSLNIGEMRVKNSDWVYFTEEGHRKNQKSIIRENDVLVVRSGAPGTACVTSKEFSGYNAVDIIIAHPHQNKINSIFLAQFTNLPHGMNQIREKTGGAAQQHFNVGGYKSLTVMLPPLAYQNQFAQFAEQTGKSKLTIQQSLDKLEMLKKALMQEYFG